MKASDLVEDVSGLITLPDVYLRISRLVDDPDSSAADIAKVISQDPSFTVRLLKVANSAIYNFSSTIDTVQKAVSVIGTTQIRNLALSLSVAKSFAGLPNELVSMENFWRHSLFCALAARNLGKTAGRCDPDALFTAGILHDIGELIMFNRLPEQEKEALTLVLDSQEEIQVNEAERRILGFDHTDVGGELARRWRLPSLLADCIECHHRIEKAQNHRREVALVHIANSIALMAEIDQIDPDEVARIDPEAWAITGLSAELIDEVVMAVQVEIEAVEKFF